MRQDLLKLTNPPFSPSKLLGLQDGGILPSRLILSTLEKKSVFIPTEATSISIAIAVKRKGSWLALQPALHSSWESITYSRETLCPGLTEKHLPCHWSSSVTAAFPAKAEAAGNSRNTEANSAAPKAASVLGTCTCSSLMKHSDCCCTHMRALLGQKCNSENIPIKNFHFSFSSFYITRCFNHVLILISRQTSHWHPGKASQIDEPNASRIGQFQFFTYVPGTTAVYSSLQGWRGLSYGVLLSTFLS